MSGTECFIILCHLIALLRKVSCYLHIFLLPISYLEIIILHIWISMQNGFEIHYVIIILLYSSQEIALGYCCIALKYYTTVIYKKWFCSIEKNKKISYYNKYFNWKKLVAKVLWINIHNKEEVSQNRDHWKSNICGNNLRYSLLNPYSWQKF